MSGSLRSRIFLGTTGVTALSLMVASLSVWLTAKTMLYRQLDHVLIEHKAFLADDHRGAARPPPSPPGGPGPGGGEGGEPPGASRPPAAPGPPGGDGPGRGPGPSDPGAITAPRGEAPRGDLPPGRPGYRGHMPAEMAAGTGTIWIEIIDPDNGHQIARTPSLTSEQHLLPGATPATAQSATALTPSMVPVGDALSDVLLDGKEVRLLVYEDDSYVRLPPFLLLGVPYQAFVPGSSTDPHLGHHLIAIACDASLVHKDLLHIRMVLISVCLGALLMAVIATLWLQRTLLRPIERISRGIQGLSPDNLAARVATSDVPTEMLVVVTRLNELLARVEVAFTHEKQTIANIAHELRTPVAGLKTTLEVTMDGTEVGELREGISRALGVADAMQSTISNLLTLARLESGVISLERRPVDLVLALRRGWDAIATRAAARFLSVQWQLPQEDLAVWCAPHMLTQILGNLFDNIVAHALPNSVVTVQVAPKQGRIAVTMANRTDGTVVDLEHVFDAFYRGSDARTAGTHCGLGLALVRRMIELHGGQVSARRDEEKRFAVTMVLATPPASSRPG